MLKARLDGWTATVPPGRAVSGALMLAVLYAVVLAVFKLLPVNDVPVFVVLLGAVVLLLSRCEAVSRGRTLHAVTQIIVLGWVFHLWTLGYEGRSAVFGGILPWSDSFDYSNDALRLLHGQAFDFAAKRPLYPILLTGLLRLTGGDFHLVLLIFAMFGAWAVALVGNAVWDSHGRRAGLIVWALLLFSERHWAGYVQTEDFGLPLGLIGFTLIWRAAALPQAERKAALKMVLAGLFAITMALMARAGAFFVLAALTLWAAWRWGLAGQRWRVVLAGGAAIVLGVAVHEIVLALAGNGASFSDYPAIVFGLIHHRDFTYLAELHPQITALEGSARSAAAWQIVIAEALSHPGALLLGLLRSLAELFYTPNGLFGFVWRNPDDMVLENGRAVRAAIAQHGWFGPVVLWVTERGLYSLINALAMGALAVCFVAAVIAALIGLYRGPADAYRRLLRFALGGVLLSAPFTPPWITQAHQVEVATLAFMAAMVALWRSSPSVRACQPASSRLYAVPLAVAGAVILFAFGLTVWPLPVPQDAKGHPMRLYGSTLVRAVPERSLNLTDRRIADLEFSLGYLNKHNRALVQSLAPHVKPGAVFLLAYDGKDRGAKILIDETGRLGQLAGWQSVDAMPLATPTVMLVKAAQPSP